MGTECFEHFLSSVTFHYKPQLSMGVQEKLLGMLMINSGPYEGPKSWPGRRCQVFSRLWRRESGKEEGVVNVLPFLHLRPGILAGTIEVVREG